MKIPDELFGSMQLPQVERVDPELLSPRPKKEPAMWRKLVDGIIEEISGYRANQRADEALRQTGERIGYEGRRTSVDEQNANTSRYQAETQRQRNEAPELIRGVSLPGRPGSSMASRHPITGAMTPIDDAADYLEPSKPRAPITRSGIAGPAGRPMHQLLDPDTFRVLSEAPEYVAPPRPQAEIVIQTPTGPQIVNRGSSTARPVTDSGGDVIGPNPTADMRNREQVRGMAQKSINAVRDLSTKVITMRGVAQRATAAGRSIESALGNDPQFRTYQDARTALAGNLAVLQQGSRPSDADIRAIWLPLVPDAFRDTDESAALKWQLIDIMSGFDKGGPAAAQGGATNAAATLAPTPPPDQSGAWRWDGKAWVKR